MAKESWTIRLRNSVNYTDQIQVLKSIKNIIVGNSLKKESLVLEGALGPITQCISKKFSTQQDVRSPSYTSVSRPLEEEEVCRLQGLQIIASIALEGPRFLAPISSAGVFQALLSNICPKSNPPQLVLASLRALSNIADSSVMASHPRTLTIGNIADGLFLPQHLESLTRVISQISSSTVTQTQISVAASLISRICREERHQQSLANSGVLDALANKIASFVVADGLVLPAAEALALRDNLQEYIPQPAPPNADFAAISGAVSVIIANSKLRCSQLIYSPSILAVFPILPSTELMGNLNQQSTYNIFNQSGISSSQVRLNWIDYILPSMPHHQTKSANSQISTFPPHDNSGCRENPSLNGISSASNPKILNFPLGRENSGSESGPIAQGITTSDHEETESPLISYLIIIIRLRTGLERLMATSILAALYRAGLTHERREVEIGLMIVPLIMQLLDESSTQIQKRDYIEAEELIKFDRAVKELAPVILATLIIDSEYLQKAAYDAGVVTRFSSILKTSYEPVSKPETLAPWSPNPDEDEKNQARCTFLGDYGQPAALVHKIKVRETTLKAIAALVPFKEEYRKSIVDQGLMPYIVESMSPNASKPSPKINLKSDKIHSETQNTSDEGSYGKNPTSVLIAACGAVRALSRSVSVLRTTLIDNGVAEPVFRLLKHPENEVQIAATATVINLLTDVSPMRDTIAKAGVLKILCEHAKSVNPKLRLNAVWALKHFVQGVNNEMKRQCVEELGHGWLVHLICDDIEDLALLSSKDNEQRLASGNNLSDEDTEMEHIGEQINTNFGKSDSQAKKYKTSTIRSISIQRAELRLAALRDAELDPAKRARKDDVAIQEQGLDFIRNLIGGVGHGTETTDMIDYLLDILGQDRVFEILASKLRPKAINPYNRKTSGSGESKVIPPQAEIIISVGYILVHMAASIPRHRQLVIAQTELLKLLVPQFNHSSVEVRIALCWLVNNLTWMDDQTDAKSCAQRVNELKKMGFLAKLEMLENDSEFSVRERVKSALWQMRKVY
ncbi:putative armadillo repeat protein [Golovinomyces cichoracearum]|uniref:Putative armadillo repeat protein n=1 Tax=Golovinomyces cichoracearum TaxID=62708 RepID=A0A420IEU6_9PEZI|nr:putative armadillo repeat protein [Golovinomyces cichoracearum]